MKIHVVFFGLLVLLYLVAPISSDYLKNHALEQAVQLYDRESISNYATVNTFYPFISQDGADPWVFKHPTNGFYYATKSTQTDVTIWRSRYLSTLDPGESKVIWTPNNTTACRDVWAPELHLVRQKWYVYFAATTCDGNNAYHRMFVLENENDDPFQGEFRFRGQLTDETNKWAIDGTVFEHPRTNDLYFIWSGWEGDVDVMQILYIAHMSNPYTIDSKRVEIARPSYAWETNHSPHVNEGPEVVIHNQIISLIFSASGSWTNDYCMGLITARIDADPMNATSWQKRADPILRSGNGLFGPGHGSLTSDNWLIFHTASYNGSGWTRQIRTQPFTWNEEDGTPLLGTLHDPNTPILLPPGEPQRQRYQLDSPVQHPIFNVEVDKNGSYFLVMQVRSKEPTKKTSYQVSIDQTDIQTIDVLYSDNWSSISVIVELQKGQNTIGFRNSGAAVGEMYSMDLFPVNASGACGMLSSILLLFVCLYLPLFFGQN